MTWLEELNENAAPQDALLNRRIGGTMDALRPIPEPRGRTETLRALRRQRGSVVPWLATGVACSLVGLLLVPAFFTAKVSSKSDRGAERATMSAPAAANGMEQDDFSASAKRTMGAAPLVGADSRTLAPNLPPQISAQVVRTANLTLEVGDVAGTQRAVLLDVRNEGGYAENSNYSDRGDGPARASILLRVPNAKFDLILDKLQSQGRVVALSNSGDDVGVEIAGAEASTSALRLQEEQLRQMMERASTTSERLSLRYRIDDVRRQITVEAAQLRHLRGQVAFSTIQLELVGRRGAFDGWMAMLNPANTFLLILILSPIWLPLIWLARRR